jgi:hypothetical protein
MQRKMYSIYDAKVKAYNTPFYAINDGEAQRMFADNVNADKANNTIARHPSDFTLFNVGTFDDEKGTVTSEAPKSVGNGVEYLNQEGFTEKQKDKLEELLEEVQAIHDKLTER